MIQDIAPKYLKNTFCEKMPKEDSRMVAFQGRTVFMKKEGSADFPAYGEVQSWCKAKNILFPEAVYLFSVEEEDYFLVELPEELLNLPEVSDYAYVRMFEVRSRKPKEKVFAAATAFHLYVWYRDNRFCGRCGGKLVHSPKQRMLECPACKNMVFPKIAPAVIVGVTDGDKLLMTRYADREYKRDALIAGFTEIGETAEETVAREVMEEVGLKVKNIHYYKSQPWGFDSNLLLGYFCELDGKGEVRLDEEELAVAEWVDYHDIEDDTEGLSLTREMMIYFREQRKK